MFGLWRRWQRRRWREKPFPEAWISILNEQVPFFEKLSGELRQSFLERLKVFAWEKVWIPAGGLEITDEIRVLISAAACRLILHLDLSYYDRLTEIVVYPATYKHPGQDDVAVFGEAHQWGTLVLSWDSVKRGLANPEDGKDTATHEFAHVLDRAGGTYDGTPPLHARPDYRHWTSVMEQNFQALRSRDRRQRRVLRRYGATNEAEFFAVATESFFEKPAVMKAKTPDLYNELKRFYRQDPASEA